LAILDRGIRESPTSPRLRLLRGEARHEQSDYTGAIEDFTVLIEQAPRDPRPLELRDQSHRRRGEGRDPALATDDEEQARQLRQKK
jgi:hypothetical protein